MLNRSPISWCSKKETTVSLSTAEAEYVALSAAGQELMWLKGLLSNSCGRSGSVVLYEDNQLAICIAANPQFYGRRKHIEIKYHFVRDLVQKGCIEIKYCNTKNMLTDILTKSLSAIQTCYLSEELEYNLNLIKPYLYGLIFLVAGVTSSSYLYILFALFYILLSV